MNCKHSTCFGNRRMHRATIIFITGTDTGVGKTVLTGLLLHYLREKGIKTLAMKPFCSGNRRDAKLLKALQSGELTEDEVNPFYFKESLAPMVAARKNRQQISLNCVLGKIRNLQKRCDLLLIEGAGGLLAPLGERFTNKDIIAKVADAVLVVGRNRLGTINHTAMTVESMQDQGIQRVKVVLMDGRFTDDSAETNCEILQEIVAGVPIFRLPFLGVNHSIPIDSKKTYQNIKKTLALVSRFDSLGLFF